MGPEPQDHPILGRLVKDGEYSWWLSQIEFLGNQVEFSLQTESQLSVELMDDAAAFANRLVIDESIYKAKIAEDIMAIDDGSAVIKNLSIEEVLKKMTLEYMAYSDDGDFQLSYRDGGIFGGHLMTGYFNHVGQLKTSEIAG